MHPPSEVKLEALALHLFKGGSVVAFARSTGISERTAQRWSALPLVAGKVTALRKQHLAMASNRLSEATAELVDALLAMARQEGGADPVRLGAIKAGLSASVAFSKHLDVDAVIQELKADRDALKDDLAELKVLLKGGR